MKARLTFDLDNLEDIKAFQRAVRADDAISALWDMAEIWRKFKHENMSDDYEEGVQRVLKMIQDVLEEHDINPFILMN